MISDLTCPRSHSYILVNTWFRTKRVLSFFLSTKGPRKAVGDGWGWGGEWVMDLSRNLKNGTSGQVARELGGKRGCVNFQTLRKASLGITQNLSIPSRL